MICFSVLSVSSVVKKVSFELWASPTLYDHQGNAGISPIKIAVPAEERKTTQELASTAGATTEILTRQQIVDNTPVFQVLQLSPDLLPDYPALATGTVAMDQRQDQAPIRAGLLKFPGKTGYGLIGKGHAPLQINNPVPGTMPGERYFCRSTAERTLYYIDLYLVTADLAVLPNHLIIACAPQSSPASAANAAATCADAAGP